MKKLSYSEMKEVKGGECPWKGGKACPYPLGPLGGPNWYCDGPSPYISCDTSSNNNGYGGGSGVPGYENPPYTPPGSYFYP